MKSLVQYLFISMCLLVLLAIVSRTLAEEASTQISGSYQGQESRTEIIPPDGRSISGEADTWQNSNSDQHAEFRKRAKPLKHIFMGIYKNYKSTYLGNKTITDYKQTLRDRINSASGLNKDQIESEIGNGENYETELEQEQEDDGIIVSEATDIPEVDAINPAVYMYNESQKDSSEFETAKQKKRKRKHQLTEPVDLWRASDDDDEEMLSFSGDEYHYNVGGGLNMSLDMQNELVNVKLDGDNLLEILRGRWLSDNSEQGRGKKYDMITKVLPLFILPFLIQSAIVPFLVTKLKLLLMKSILVGKLAIFLLVISAFRQGNKGMQTYEVAPSYWAGEPSRRSELAAAASSAAAYNGYRVEGKPTAWIN